MPGNRKQRERVAMALTAPGRLQEATPELVVACMVAEHSGDMLDLLCKAMPDYTTAEEALPDVCKAAGVSFNP